MNGQAVAIPLGLPLLEASCSQPGDESSSHNPPIWPCSGWGLPAITSLLMAGSSYPPDFTLTPAKPERFVSVALSVGSPRLDVIQHPARLELGLSSPPE